MLMPAMMRIRRSLILKVLIMAATASVASSFDNEGLSLLVTENSWLLRMTFSDKGVDENVVNEGSDRICGLAYDPVEKLVYWRDWVRGSIWKTDIAHGNYEEILPDSHITWNYLTCGLSFDIREKKLFYDGPDFSQISVLDLKTSQSKVLMEVPDGGHALDIALDGKRRIYSVPYEGGNATTLISRPGYNFYRLQVIAKVPFLEERPEITFNLMPSEKASSEELTFYCNFKEHFDVVSYRTLWSVNGQVSVEKEPAKWSSGEVIYVQGLTENDLMDAGIQNVGFEVQCSVEADKDGIVSRSLNSSSEFIGIQLSETSLSLTEGEIKNISLQLTAPFGCVVPTEPCHLHIEAFKTEKIDEPSVLIPEGRVVVDSSHWNDSVDLTLVGSITPTYGTLNTTITLKLVTSSDMEHRIWADYELGAVQVELTKDTSAVKGKSCHSENDPHMKTFDGRRYEHQFEGNFTLYKHMRFPLEVEIQTTRCRISQNAWCNCGVAVRAGRTVFEINRCPGQHGIWMMRYALCEEEQDVLQVTKSRGSNYDIFLPTGGKVSVNVFKYLLNVHIYPSVHDVDSSAGLCGRLSQNDLCSDDFVLRNGSYSTDNSATFDCRTGYAVWQHDLISFSESWRAMEGNNLFDHKNQGSLGGWPYRKKFCSLPHIEKRGQGDDDVHTNECSSGFILKPRIQHDYGHVYCNTKQQKRLGRINQSLIRGKRQAETSPGNWTEKSARAECEKLFQESRSVQVCGDIEGVDTNSSIDNCVLDILLTQTTYFGPYSVDTVRSKCLNEVAVNPILQENSSQSNESIYDIVTAQACPNDCSGHGNCSEETQCQIETTTTLTSISVSEPTTDPTTEQSTEPSSESITTTTTEPTSKVTTEPTTESTIEPTAEHTTAPTTGPTTPPITETTAEPTTERTAVPTTEPITELTTEPITEPTTQQPIEPTAEPTTEITATESDTTESATDTSTEKTSEDTHTSTKRDYQESVDKLGLNDDTVSAIAISGGVAFFFLLVTVIVIITLKLRRGNGSQSTEATTANENQSFWSCDPAYREEGSIPASRTDEANTV